MKRKYVLLVSGGPDSMYLLTRYHAEALAVLHVNYHRRLSATRDENLVRAACLKHQVPLVVEHFQPPKGINNFQAAARAFRLAKANALAQTLKARAVMSAHHKDDFLETARWQIETGRTPRQYGMTRTSTIAGVKYVHPLLDLWKNEILAYLATHQIAYGIDETNDLPLYRRNVIRWALAQLDEATKAAEYARLVKINKERAQTFRTIDQLAAMWKATHYAVQAWSACVPYQREVLFIVLHERVPNLHISRPKLESVARFIAASASDKSYVLNSRTLLQKTHHHLQFVNSTNAV